MVYISTGSLLYTLVGFVGRFVILNFIRNVASSEPGALIIYKARGTNTVADSLAKQGLSRRDEFITWV